MEKMNAEAFLQIEKGRIEGYTREGKIPLGTGALRVGRTSQKNAPDIKVKDEYVSRNHVEFSYIGGHFMLRDVGSRNGTEINGERIEPGKFYPLTNGDFIGLAIISGEPRVVLRFSRPRQSEETQYLPAHPPKKAEGLIIDVKARGVFVDGSEVSLGRREFNLLVFLYQNRGRACSESEIAEKVWADEGGAVSPEAIKLCVQSIKKGIEADPSKPRYITTLPQYGYRLEW
jgi:hypothetical protein